MSDLELVGRLAMSLLCGTLIGIERQWHHKNAGIKTNTLVTLGAAAFGLISERGFGANANPAQVAAGVVTGIGFIGAGVILRRAGSVQGINSAATLWAAGGLGLSIGQGYYLLAWMMLIAILVTQITLRRIAAVVDKRSGLVNPALTYKLSVRVSREGTDAARATWTEFADRRGIAISRYSEVIGSDGHLELDAQFGLTDSRVSEMAKLAQKFASVPGVTSSEWSRSEVIERD